MRESHPKYRSKETMCKDLVTVLQIDVSLGTKCSVIDLILWRWTEFNGKLKGCEYWSADAKKSDDSKLVHEHLVPRSIISQKLLELESPEYDEIYSLLDAFCIGVIVTKEEDQRLNKIGLRQKMPDGWDGKDAWARHKVAGITLAQ